MRFAHDTEEALVGAAALVNTLGPHSGKDSLTGRRALDEFVSRFRFSGSRAPAAEADQELAEVRALRHELHRLWTAPTSDVLVDGVNRMLVDGGARPQLVRHDGWDWHLHATSADQPLAVRMSVEAAMALMDVVRSGEVDRLKVCEGDDCDDVHVDLSKNRSRRYCEAGCGNRANVAAYRARKAGAG